MFTLYDALNNRRWLFPDSTRLKSGTAAILVRRASDFVVVNNLKKLNDTDEFPSLIDQYFMNLEGMFALDSIEVKMLETHRLRVMDAIHQGGITLWRNTKYDDDNCEILIYQFNNDAYIRVPAAAFAGSYAQVGSTLRLFEEMGQPVNQGSDI